MSGQPLDTGLLLDLGRTAIQMKQDGARECDIRDLLRWPGETDEVKMRRAREAIAVYEFWPPVVIDAARQYAAPWHTLVEPTQRDYGSKLELLVKLRQFLTDFRRWPKVDTWRRWAGKQTNHRKPGDNPEQEGMF